MIFVNCPLCGQRLIEGKYGSAVRLKCSKCGEIIRVVIKEDGITILPNKDKIKTIEGAIAPK